MRQTIQRNGLKGHRKSIHSHGDSYLSSANFSDKTVCSDCSSFYMSKIWHRNPARLKNILKDPAVQYSRCPACLKIKDNYPQGFVKLKGEFFNVHKDEIMRLVANEEKRATGFNPLERIIEIVEKDDSVIITTTVEKLAQRIGRAIKKAYSGTVKYSWSVENKMARVAWER